MRHLFNTLICCTRDQALFQVAQNGSVKNLCDIGGKQIIQVVEIGNVLDSHRVLILDLLDQSVDVPLGHDVIRRPIVHVDV